jgi:biopolymer transport protein ExbD
MLSSNGSLLRRESDTGSETEMQMTPLIDMVFLLLIFFLVTASLKKPHKELPVRLHRASHAKLAKFEDQFIVTITADGDRYIDDGGEYRNQAPVSRQELVQRLQKLSHENPNMPVRLDVDRRVRYYHIMDLADTLELYGLHRLSLRSQHGFTDEKR